MKTTGVHEYLSTACWHELNDDRPELHGSCRASCKYAPGDPEYCVCPNHPENDSRELPPSWVDQARNVALRLLAVIDDAGIDLASAEPDLHERRRWDPTLFWVRGEEHLPGEWQPTPEEPT